MEWLQDNDLLLVKDKKGMHAVKWAKEVLHWKGLRNLEGAREELEGNSGCKFAHDSDTSMLRKRAMCLAAILVV